MYGLKCHDGFCNPSGSRNRDFIPFYMPEICDWYGCGGIWSDDYETSFLYIN